MTPEISRFLVGVGVMLFGLAICAIALDFIRLAPGSIHAPRSVVLLTGLALVFIGSSLMVRRVGVTAYLYFSAFAFCFACVFGWVAVYAPPGSISGSFIPNLSRHANDLISRSLFGLVAIMGGIICIATLVRLKKLLSDKRYAANSDNKI